ncbi:MAG TPA: crossover junction endodeoxyribonuclease RuvC [Methylomusa anaerophila]|uniref:Crossover junction endodeoxyribonuclease RuvC n=1 Tax=Methylomusa anaerophila TaxID=1930071 RepID=A0A348AP60_9FIRM|nr:crossover junction endodeoxyribonuclease RuvC [Methylomusa anaerophila]BBB92858.1 crossover junction endodeoxyribonuclease RuvC [Methylomusa anaerophila]HML87306.1 crossover junction endodeoxyribonuclease RuvC [Methylomusa anaerophila]
MLALGIDPGTAICGYGLVEQSGSRLRAVTYGAVQTRSDLEAADRLLKVYEGIELLIKNYHPDIVGVEQLFFNKNVRTAMAVGQAKGVVLLAAVQNGVSVAEFTPLQVKQSVVGYGNAAKEQVIYMTQRLLNLSQKPHPDDVADALAVAICTLHINGANRIATKIKEVFS